MKRKALIAIITLAASMSATASSWNVMKIDHPTYPIAVYFDAKSVKISKDKDNNKIVDLWLKLVQKDQCYSDGTCATAVRWAIHCDKEKIYTLDESYYDKNGKFIRSSQYDDVSFLISEGEPNHSIAQIACDPTFPNDKSKKNYVLLPDNDPIEFTKDIVRYEKSKKDRAPK